MLCGLSGNCNNRGACSFTIRWYLHQGPDLLCLLAKRGGVRAPRDAALARVQVGAGVEVGVGARVYPGKILCCRVASRVSEAGEDAYLVIISDELIRVISIMLDFI
ncbi:hypothetical protein V6N13_146803 [Hibiscus sabdariffa]